MNARRPMLPGRSAQRFLETMFLVNEKRQHSIFGHLNPDNQSPNPNSGLLNWKTLELRQNSGRRSSGAQV